MSKFISRLSAVAALALAATPIIGLTSAAHAAEAPAARIKISDLSLSNPDDAREFARRASAAGFRACDAQGLRGLSLTACMADFNADVKDALSARQAADLKIAQRSGARIALARN